MHKQNHDGFTLIELLMVVAVIGIISAIALPLLLRSKIAGNEASAIGSMRATVSAQHDYHAFHSGYAIDLATLAAGCPVSPSAFISADMDGNDIVKNGYIYALASGAGAVDGPADCRGVTTKTSYYGTAKPSTVSFTGNRAFAVNVVSTIWQDLTGVPPAEPFTMSPTVSPLGRP